LLVLIWVILAYDSVEFFLAFSDKNEGAWMTTPGWLKVMVYIAPFVVWANWFLGSFQVHQHMRCIQEEAAVLRHDRAVQIIVLPMVYSTMCLSCVTKCYAFLVKDLTPMDNKELPLAIAEAETCLWIGDLYEAWALYQFGVLSLEVMESSLVRQANSDDQEAKAAANALMVAHGAVSRLAWLGILSFVLVSVADSAVALGYLTVGQYLDIPHLVDKFNNAENQFNIAGFLASCAAIFNVYVVEQQFHHFLEEFHPFLKFLTVKILVTFAYGQQYILLALRAVDDMVPARIQAILQRVPILGDVLQFNEPQFWIFYSALLIIECFLIAIAHVFAWGTAEVWYEDEDEKGVRAEDRKLLPGENLLYGSSAKV